MTSLRFRSSLFLVLGWSVPAFASGIVYTCDSTGPDAVDTATCDYLNGPIAGLYNSTFTNANASIYIEYGTTSLGESTAGPFDNEVSYATYLADLTATASHDTVDLDALTSLNSLDTAVYGSGDVEITSALAGALGITTVVGGGPIEGVNAFGGPCLNPGVGSCYNGLIVITTQANLSSETGDTQFLYYRQNGGTQPSDAYDYYSIVEHETDEILGTASCITTQTTPLSDGCPGTNTPSAVDLFRYASAGQLVTTSALSTTPGAYFSYNGGISNGADGADYNTLDNGQDYADFVTNCQHVQDSTGCLGQGFDITNDGGPEINILDAVGYNTVVAPEPGTMEMLVFGFTGVAALAYRRRRLFIAEKPAILSQSEHV